MIAPAEHEARRLRERIAKHRADARNWRLTADNTYDSDDRAEAWEIAEMHEMWARQDEDALTDLTVAELVS